MDADKPVKMTDVLDRAGVPKDKYEERMNAALAVLGDLKIWPNGLDRETDFPYSKCHFIDASKVYVKKKDVRRVLDVFMNEDWKLGATNRT